MQQVSIKMLRRDAPDVDVRGLKIGYLLIMLIPQHLVHPPRVHFTLNGAFGVRRSAFGRLNF